jgi:epoxyqueuosine reductase QueG
MGSNGLMKDPSEWLKRLIESFIAESPENSLGNRKKDRAWEKPLIGFSAGGDPLYQFYKSDIGDFYWTPLEIFLKTFPASKVTADKLTVISWVLPQTEATKADNRKQTKYPSERWARARVQGEEVNNRLRKIVVSSLHENGFRAVAPMLSLLWEQRASEHYGLASTWSERHAAYTSGLGTFGLCDGLITPRGKAMRCGSVVADIKISSTRRPYSDHHAYCLYFSKGICGKCIQRCPAGAISRAGHDKTKCRNYLHDVVEEFVKSNYGFNSYGCGLCQTGVPCESKIPTEQDVE